MPTPYSFDELSSRLYDDFTWRLREVHALRKSLESSQDVYQDAIARAALAILYAHWEGYVKVCAECYLGFVAVRRLKIKNLNSHFLYLDNYQRIKRLASGSSNVVEKIQIVREIVECVDNQNRSKHYDKISTGSNLNFNNLKYICDTIGIDIENFRDEETFINLIVERRNFIAHGNEHIVKLGEFRDQSERMLGLMRQFRNCIENAVLDEAYKNAALV